MPHGAAEETDALSPELRGHYCLLLHHLEIMSPSAQLQHRQWVEPTDNSQSAPTIQPRERFAILPVDNQQVAR